MSYGDIQDKKKSQSFPNANTTVKYSGEKPSLENPDAIQYRTTMRSQKSLDDLSVEELQWRNEQIEALGGVEAYRKKYGKTEQRTGRVVNKMYNAPEGMGVDKAIGTEIYKYFKNKKDREGMNKWMAEQNLIIKTGEKNKFQMGKWTPAQ